MNAQTTRDTIAQLLGNFSGQQNMLVIPRPYIALCGDHLSALLLSQIVYWSDRTSDPDGWFSKSYKEWDEELGMSEYQVRRAANNLKAFGVEVEKRRSQHHEYAPTLHYRIDMGTLSECILKKLQNHDPEETQESLHTKTTPEPTAENAAAAPAPLPTPVVEDDPPRPTIYGLYEQAFGMLIHSPMLGQELKEAAQEWPEEWLADAFKEAAVSNGRSWKYVKAILESWQRNGKPQAKAAPTQNGHAPSAVSTPATPVLTPPIKVDFDEFQKRAAEIAARAKQGGNNGDHT